MQYQIPAGTSFYLYGTGASESDMIYIMYDNTANNQNPGTGWSNNYFVNQSNVSWESVGEPDSTNSLPSWINPNFQENGEPEPKTIYMNTNQTNLINFKMTSQIIDPQPITYNNFKTLATLEIKEDVVTSLTSKRRKNKK